MNIADIMKTDVKSCHPDDSLHTAARLMWDHDIGSLPVVDSGGQVIGMVTDRDIAMAAYTRGRPLHDIRVDETFSGTAHTIAAESSPAEALGLMREYAIRRLPVTNGDMRLHGIVTLNDLALASHVPDGPRADEVAKTLATICGPRALASA